MTSNNIILTGDRPTGALHIGHYIGSLQSRLALQSLEPIRKKREDLAKNKGDVLSLLKDGSIKARSVTAKTLFEVKQAMKIYQF